LSSTIENACQSIGLSSIFVAAILLPIVGNAAEHASAVMFAVKGKLDLTLGVAIGSSTQIALLVIPFTVILGWIWNKDMSLNFGVFESSCLFASVFIVTVAMQNGSSNWLLGVTLMLAYVFVSVGFLTHIDEKLQ
jgi:Ca2+:H+ antiporter